MIKRLFSYVFDDLQPFGETLKSRVKSCAPTIYELIKDKVVPGDTNVKVMDIINFEICHLDVQPLTKGEDIRKSLARVEEAYKEVQML